VTVTDFAAAGAIEMPKMTAAPMSNCLITLSLFYQNQQFLFHACESYNNKKK
jgi:hypothetical protein